MCQIKQNLLHCWKNTLKIFYIQRNILYISASIKSLRPGAKAVSKLCLHKRYIKSRKHKGLFLRSTNIPLWMTVRYSILVPQICVCNRISGHLALFSIQQASAHISITFPQFSQTLSFYKYQLGEVVKRKKGKIPKLSFNRNLIFPKFHPVTMIDFSKCLTVIHRVASLA